MQLPPEAILTWDSVRRLELHTDIGPGGASPLLIEVNFRQHQHVLALLRDGGWLAEGCSCGKPFPEDGGKFGVCECCSTCTASVS